MQRCANGPRTKSRPIPRLQRRRIRSCSLRKLRRPQRPKSPRARVARQAAVPLLRAPLPKARLARGPVLRSPRRPQEALAASVSARLASALAVSALQAPAASAAGAAGDAEIGIQHVSMAIAGSGGLNERTDLAATATGGGSAHTLVGDVNLHMDSSGIGTSAAPIAAQIHMGAGEGTEPGIIASASGAGSSATVGVTGNVALSGHADEVYVYNSGVFAQGTT